MWRARSDGDDRPLHNDDNHIGSGGVSPSEPADDRTADDPRSEPTGRKIRRIESGPPGLGAERGRPGPASGPSLARRRPGGSNGQGAANGQNGSGIDDPRAGRSGSAAGRRGRNAGRPDREAPGSGGVFGVGAAAAGGPAAGGLPPLRQPTGENPVVNGSGESAKPGPKASGSDDAAPSDDLSGWPTDLPVKGVFGDDGDIDLTTAVSDPLDDLAEDAGRSIDTSMPSALSAAGSARAAGRAGRSAASATAGADDLRAAADSAADRAGSGANGLADSARSAASDATAAMPSAAMPSAFPDTDGRPGDSSFPSWTAAKTDASSSIDETLAMGPMATGRGSRTADRSGPATADRRPTQGVGQSARPGSRATGSQRLQETEIKLAGRQSAPERPREPNRALLGLALALVVLAGAAVAWWLTRDDGGDQSAAGGEQEQLAETTTTLASGDAGAVPEPDAPAVEEPVLDVPTLSLLDVDPGPLDSETTYSLDLFGEPAGSMLQVVVDDVPQGQPDVILPDLILPAGRHTLIVNVTDGAGTRLSSPVEVYVLDAPPALGTLANLASIDMVNEGWDEAIRRFDEYRAAGHQNVRLLPITPGFWNIFVPDHADADAVATYCDGFGLAVPDDCFAKDFDPATYQGPTAAAAPTADDGADTADDGSMTDEGGTDTSTSTTTGG